MDKIAELYTDYLIASSGLTTATGLSDLLDGAVSHDRVTRFLAGTRKTSRDLWKMVKPLVRQVETNRGCLVLDDSIAEKPSTDENEIICWHFDHASGRMVKGINFLTCLYETGEVALPLAFDLISKTEFYIDPKDGKEKRRSPISKNELARQQIGQIIKNGVKFGYVLFDQWFASIENMKFILRHKKHFSCPLKANRKVALSKADRLAGRWQKLETVDIKEQTSREIYLEGLESPVRLVKQVFTNEDGKTHEQYLVSSDLKLTAAEIIDGYHRRWRVEEYHKSLKQNASLEKSPTQTVTTQTNHFYAALCAYVKLERLKMKTHENHFAMKAKLYLKGLVSSFESLQQLSKNYLSA